MGSERRWASKLQRPDRPAPASWINWGSSSAMSGENAVSSPPPNTSGCEQRICSTSVLPERGMPTMKMGASLASPAQG